MNHAIKTIKRVTLAAIAAVLILGILSGCGRPASPPSGESPDGSVPPYASFRGIPGVTEGEIKAIEEFQSQGVTFVYGAVPSTETFVGQDGEITGFSALFCEWLSVLFGIPFKPALYEWDDLLAGLESGEIDFTGEMSVAEELRNTYFMTDTISERLIKYFRIAGSVPLSYIAASRPPRFAFLSETTTIGKVTAQLEGEYEIFLADEYEEVYRMFKEEKIDAFIDENTGEEAFNIYGDVVSEDFYPLIYEPISLATQKKTNEVITSVVQKVLHSGGRPYLSELHNEGMNTYKKHKLSISFTEEERAYIESRPVIRFAAEHDNYPISFYNTHDRAFQGVCFDVLNEIGALTGLRFELVNDQTADWADIMKMLEDGDADMVSELIRTTERVGRFLWPKTAVLTDYYALISKSDFRNININEVQNVRVALVDDYAQTELFNQWFPDHRNTVVYNNFDQAFDALARNEVVMAMGSQNQLLLQTNFRELPGYKANIVFDFPFESTFGINKDEAVLCSVIDKALRHIDARRIADQWTRKTYDYRAKVEQARLPWFIGAVILLLLVIILLFVLYRKISSEEKRLEILVQKRTAEIDEQRKLLEHMSMTDQLTDMPNRRYFDNWMDKEWRAAIRNKTLISIMVIDIDRFKTYNDTYGHQQGDVVLQSVAEVIKGEIRRPGDFAARWGGEEFVVLLSDTDCGGALKVAEAIRANVEKLSIPLPDGAAAGATVSIGVNTQTPGRDISWDSFISAADNALYKAKEIGRNRVCAAEGQAA